MRIIERDIIIQSSLELVWLAWTSGERIVKWFAPAANINAHVGGPYELFFNPTNRDGMCTKGCSVTALEPHKLLGFQWKGPDDFADTMNGEDSLTAVTVLFDGDESVTRIKLTHTGWGEGSAWAAAYAWHEGAWGHVLGSLRSALEAGQGELCCIPADIKAD